jgi:lysylphosphatidylglycerol synthetase-like protein (DUF2156 family)
MSPTASATLRAFGSDSLSYATAMSDKRVLECISRDCYVAYREASGVALALGAPIGPRSSWERMLSEFEAHSRMLRLHPAFCGVGADAALFFQSRGYRLLKVGEDAGIDLPTFTLRGKAREGLRTAMNRAGRRGVTFSWMPPERRTPCFLAEARAVSDAWQSGRPMPPLGFAMGDITTLADPEVRVAIARNADGALRGFVTWMPVHTHGGWALDLMRRAPDAMPGLMDFLITRSLLAFQSEGVAHASLSGAPLANHQREGGLAHSLLQATVARTHGLYNFKSLAHFKRKFGPTWEPRYLAYKGALSLPRVAYAVLAACAPWLRPAMLPRMAARGVLAK